MMKKTTKLKLERTTIATLNDANLKHVVGGQPKDNHTHSACVGQSCETDAFTQCQSIPANCW